MEDFAKRRKAGRFTREGILAQSSYSFLSVVRRGHPVSDDTRSISTRHLGSRQGDSPSIQFTGLFRAASSFRIENEFPSAGHEQAHNRQIVSSVRSRRFELVSVPVGALNRHLMVRDMSSVDFGRIGEDAGCDAAKAKHLCGLDCVWSGSGLFDIGHVKRGKGLKTLSQPGRLLQHESRCPVTSARSIETSMDTHQLPCERFVCSRSVIDDSVRHQTLLVCRMGETVETGPTGSVASGMRNVFGGGVRENGSEEGIGPSPSAKRFVIGR